MSQQRQGSSSPLKVWINGLSGRMGAILKDMIAADQEFVFLSGANVDDFEEKVKSLSQADLIIDFSTTEGSQRLASYLVKQTNLSGQAYLVCTTGLSHDTTALWQTVGRDKGHRVLLAPNTSLGVYLTLKAALSVSSVAVNEGFDLVIEETHHKNKADAPSGTALLLGREIAEKSDLKMTTEVNKAWTPKTLPVAAIRGGGVFGEHTIRMIGDHEEIKITHRAFSRGLFAKGALSLGRWLSAQKNGYHHYNDVNF